ncbi:DUF932 domain-containing protein [Nocardia vinacea]|uniref:DUF932 domain-containing protein n=1 Tax=Nocardia vinacea TaxID=96468 RepID=UPI0033D92EB2
MTLIGMTEKRGNAWHYRAQEQGDKSNHYPGFVPVGDVIERLFHWHAENAPLYLPVPAGPEDCNFIGPNGEMLRMVLQEGRNLTYRPDTEEFFGMFATDSIHQYDKWLLENLAHLVTPDGLAVTSDSLGIGSAGLLRGGAQAWVQLEPADNFTTPEGVVFRTHIMAYSSHNGSQSTTYGMAQTNVVCDNTMSIAIGEMRESGMRYKVRRSANSMTNKRIDDARKAMNLVIASADSFAEEVKRLCETTVTDRQWQAFLGEWAPMPEKEGRGRTMAENKRENLTNLWRNDQRVAPWSGTAWGVVQATNTYDHHVAPMKGGLTRSERNTSRAISGDQAESDAKTLRLLDLVLANA